MKTLIKILCLSSFLLANDYFFEAHAGLGNLYSQNLFGASIGYKINNNINLVGSAGFLPYLPSISSALLVTKNINKENNFITGLIISYDESFGTGDNSIKFTLPIAYKMQFDFIDNRLTSLTFGCKYQNRYYNDQADKEIAYESNTMCFACLSLGNILK